MNEANTGSARPLSQFLRMAVMAGVESAVHVHIDRGDDLNARDASGMTPLMLAAARNNPDICKLLLSAGANHSLLDPLGRTALEIAIASGSEATAAVLEGVRAPTPYLPPSEIEVGPEPQLATKSSLPVAEAALTVESETAIAIIEPESLAEPIAQEPALPPSAVTDEMNDEEFDLSGWEAEEDQTRPEADLTVVDLASAVQIAITTHQPIDSSADWDDIDAYLPDVALPLARADDAEGRARLRRLLLRALREGSVPALDVQAQSTNEDGSANPEAEAYLTMVINDLGAEVDERVDYDDADESFEVFVDVDETPEEEAALDEALVAIDRAASPRHEPLRIYQREFQRMRLLTADEEIQLAKEMETALEAALDALATWPAGLARTLAASADAIEGSRQLSSIWAGGEPDPQPASAESLDGDELAEPIQGEVSDEDCEPDAEAPAGAVVATFRKACEQLAALVDSEDGPRATAREVRQALVGLRLNRRFLLELIDAASGSAHCSGFRRAMADFRKARDRMATANLKLAFFHAKKYRYSGEPLDDLAQEGNIGLLKAVDRYDWRRGFRFSTYATWWIRQQISRHVADKVRTIRLPVHVHEKLQRVERMAQDLQTVIGREPTLDELAQRVDMPRERLAALLRSGAEVSTIDEATVDGMIAADARDAHVSPDPADVVFQIQLSRALDHYISSLSAKDRKEERVLRLRFGIGVDEALTLDEIGMQYEVTRERIRQIEAKALEKLRHPVRSKPFAQMVLGLEPEENPLALGAPGTAVAVGSDETEVAAPKRSAAPRPHREPVESSGYPKPSELDRILMQAAEIGIPVDDDRPGSGRIWVELMEVRDNRHRKLVRRLLGFGFSFRPGKGYWR